MQSSNKNALLDSDRIMYSIVMISLPMMATGIVDALYNVVDSIFVGRYIGERALAALTVNNIIQMFLQALANLYGAGMVSIISRALGARDEEKVQNTMVNGVFLCFLTTTCFSFLLLFNIDSVLTYLGSSADILTYSRQYGQVILWFGFLMPTNSVLTGILRARGEVKTIMLLALCSAFLNVTLDALFIIVFGWGVTGAALATIMAQSCNMMILLRRVIKSYQVRFELHYLKKMTFGLVREIYGLGISNFFRSLTFVLMNASANRALALYGTAALASYGIVNRISQIAFMPIFSSNLGTQVLIGYNYGAKRYDKVNDIIKKAMIFTTALGIVPSIIFMNAPRELYELFTSSEEIITYAKKASFIIGTTFFLYGIQISSAGALLALGFPKESLFLAILRPFIMAVCVNILPLIFGLYGVWMAWPFTDVLTVVISVYVMSYKVKSIRQQGEEMKALAELKEESSE